MHFFIRVDSCYSWLNSSTESDSNRRVCGISCRVASRRYDEDPPQQADFQNPLMGLHRYRELSHPTVTNLPIS